jgi:hypothetical protein
VTLQPVDCYGAFDLESTPLPTMAEPLVREIDRAHAATVIIIGLLVTITLIDLWLLWTHRFTISQRLQHLGRAHRWLAWLGLIAFSVTGWHVWFGFPWSRRW